MTFDLLKFDQCSLECVNGDRYVNLWEHLNWTVARVRSIARFSILIFKALIISKFIFVKEMIKNFGKFIGESLVIKNRRLVCSYKSFIWWNSKPMVAIFRSKSAIFDGFPRISSTAYNIRPPLYVLQSHMKILNLFYETAYLESYRPVYIYQ